MNKSLLTGLVVGGVAVTAAGAYAGYQTMDQGRSAKVLNVEPMSRTVKTPRQVCASEVVTHQAAVKDPKRVTGSIIGAVAGGLLGNQIGDGDGQPAVTPAARSRKTCRKAIRPRRSNNAAARSMTRSKSPTATRCATALVTTKVRYGWTMTRATASRSKTAS